MNIDELHVLLYTTLSDNEGLGILVTVYDRHIVGIYNTTLEQWVGVLTPLDIEVMKIIRFDT